jgi:hypothetical protein
LSVAERELNYESQDVCVAGSPAISAMKSIAELFTDLAQAANANPTGAKVTFDGLAALAGGLAALAALNWDTVKEGVKALDDFQASVSKFGAQFQSEISAIPAELVDAISKLPGEVSGAIDTAFAAIAHNIATAAGNMLGDVESWIGCT